MKTLLLFAALGLSLASCTVSTEITATGREPHTRYEDKRILRSVDQLASRRQAPTEKAKIVSKN